MSAPHFADCLVACFLTLVPATASRAEDGGPSPRRKAEIDEVIARRQAAKQKLARGAAIREAEIARAFAETRAYEACIARTYAINQAALQRETMNQGYWFNRADRNPVPQYYATPFVSTGVHWGPVIVNFPTQGPTTEGHPSSPAHSGGQVREALDIHTAHHAEHHGHTR